ncbi:MAG: oxidoreductase [Bacteroidota bacterium]|nr:oxidoreductase [Bacteroidota bacterium]
MLRKALVIGATGLIGRNLVFELLKSNIYEKVVVLVRKDMVIKHAKLEQVIIDFDLLNEAQQYMDTDDVFCCLGSTKAKTPGHADYRKVDYDYPLNTAKLALAKGAKQFLLVSSMGASMSSNLFYNKTKGEIEDAISKLNYPSFYIFRPALLLGSRNEYRPLESITQSVFKVINPLFLGPLRSYKAIEGTTVARALVKAATQKIPGKTIWLNPQIMDLAASKT